jgi:hypothetical protein
MKTCETCEREQKQCAECERKERRRVAAKRRRQATRDVYASLGMVRVRGALGGVYYE